MYPVKHKINVMLSKRFIGPIIIYDGDCGIDTRGSNQMWVVIYMHMLKVIIMWFFNGCLNLSIQHLEILDGRVGQRGRERD